MNATELNSRIRTLVLAGTLFAMATSGCGSDPTTTTSVESSEPDATVAAAELDGRLDCESGNRWEVQSGNAAGAVGHGTIQDALESGLGAYVKTGDTLRISNTSGSVVRDGAEIVRAGTLPAEGGGYLISSISGCEGTER